MMCHIITHVLEFNNWRAYTEMIEFAKSRYANFYPQYKIEVPERIEGRGWTLLLMTHKRLFREYTPKDHEEMSIYGKILFEVTKDG